MPGCRLEFRVVPYHHFLFTVLCLAGFANGLVHIRETNLEGKFPYFAFGAILGGIHFILVVLAHIFNDQVKNKEQRHEAPETIGSYRFLLFFFTLFCIASGALTGTHGFCQRGEAKALAVTPAPKPAPKTQPTASQKGDNKPKNPTPNKTEPSKVTTDSKVTPAKTEPTKVTPAKTEPPKVTPDKTEPPKVTLDKTEPPKVTPDKTKPSKVTPDKTAPITTIIVNTIGSDMNTTDSYTFQTEEEDALRLLRLHQAQEAVRNTQIVYYSEGFKDDGRTHMPPYPLSQVPTPPSYENTMAGTYPAQDSLQPAVLESGQISADIHPLPVLPPKCLEDPPYP